MKRCGYTGDRVHELKFRAGPELFHTLKSLSEETQIAVAVLLRDLVNEALEQKREKAELMHEV